MKLLISLDSFDANHNVIFGAVAFVRQILGENGERPTSSWSWTGTVPISTERVREVAIPMPGVYQIEVVLPSGQRLINQRSVSVGDIRQVKFEPQPVNKLPTEDETFISSPNDAERVTVRQPSDMYILKGAPSAVPMKSTVKAAQTEDTIILMRATKQRTPLWKDLLELSNSFGVEPHDAQVAIAKTYKHVAHDACLRAVPSSQVKTWLIESNISQCEGRVFAAIRVKNKTNLASLPYPWHVPHGHTTMEIVGRKMQSEFCAAVIIRDEVLDGLLAYLGTRSIFAAATILREVQETLTTVLKEGTSPLAATLAAYISSASTDRRECADGLWRAAWAPDRLILQARERLRFAKNKEDVDGAKRGFVEAYRSGLPYFSAGVEYLADGLAVFAEEDDTIRTMANHVSAARSRIDPTQVFTVMKLG